MPYTQHRTILIVEEDNGDQAILSQALKTVALENPLVFAASMQTARAFLWQATAQAESCPCLILLDLSRSPHEGLNFLQGLRSEARTRRIPVILITDDQSQDLMTSYTIGANSCIAKTDDMDAFCEKIRCLCMYWLDICQLPS